MKKTLIAALIASGSITPLFAQKPPQLPSGGAKNTGGGGNDTIQRHDTGGGPSAHGQEIPMIDPTNKTIDFQGKKYSLMDNNLGGQFEAYLATDTLSAVSAIEYRKTLRLILDYLAPNKTKGARIKPAYNLLSKASQYPGDGNLCESLANAIYAAKLTQNKGGNNKEYITKLRNEEKKLVNNMGVLENKLEINPKNKGGGKRGGRKGGGIQGGTSGVDSIEYKMMQKRILEIAAIIKKTEIEGTIDIAQSKIQYQSMMVQLFMQRRFDHVVMAARFYNLLYKDGDNKMRLKRGSDTEKFFSEGIGVNPTVAGLDAAANEAIRKVKTLISAFENNIKSNRIHAASERLVEAFAIGEFTTAVQVVPYKNKNKIQQYVQDANDLIKTLEAKDLERGEELNKSLKKQASDYNASEATSYIAGKKTESISYARDAKMALYQMKKATESQERNNQDNRFKSSMFRATSAWPSNPDLKEINDLLDRVIKGAEEGEDLLLSARKDFDHYIETKSWNAILNDDNLPRFTAAFGMSKEAQDFTRRKKLKEIIKEKTSVIAAIRKAQALDDGGSPEAAWEAIHIEFQKHPDDIELSRALASYSGKAAKFSNLIAQAKGFEKDSPTSARALTYYLKAEKINPRSQYASDGIQRIIEAKFDKAEQIVQSINEE